MPGEVAYLDTEDVLVLHREALGCSAAEARNRLRNRDGLESAVARPSWHAHYSGALDLAQNEVEPTRGLEPRTCRLRGGCSNYEP
jgi:hypothetical protein